MGPSQAGLGPGATAAVASDSLGSDSPVLSCSLAQATADRTAGLPSSQSRASVGTRLGSGLRVHVRAGHAALT